MIEGHLYTTGIVKSDYPENIKSQIEGLPVDCEIVIHHISSPGGNVYAAWKAIPELMKIGKPIKSLIEGEASSIASWIAVLGSEVEATDPSTMLIHEPFYPEGIDGALRIDDLENAKTELAQIRQSMAEAYSKKSGRPVDEMLALMKNNTRMSVGMMKSYGLIDSITPNEPRRIAAQVIEEFKKDFEDLKKEVMSLFGKKIIAGPAALDLKTKDGKTLSIQTENGDLAGKQATLDGTPADGVIQLADGRSVTAANGVIVSVQEAQAAVPQQTEAQQLQAQLAAANAKLAEIAANEAKAKAEAEAKIKAEADAKAAAETAKALEESKEKIAALAKQVEELGAKPAGSTAKPNEGMIAARQPVGFAKSQPNAVAMDLTRAFINEHMTWLKPYYAEDFFKNTPSMVSILETNFNYTYPGILTTDIYYKPTLDSPALSDIFTIDQDIKFQKQYNLVTELNKIVQPYTGCGGTPAGNRQFITNTTVRTKEFQMYEGWCKDDFTGQLTGIYNNLAQEWLKTGLDSFDPAGTPIDKIIMTVLKDAMRRDIFRRVSFAAGNSSDSDYNQIDGLWDRLIDSSGASNYCVVRAGAAQGIGTPAAGAALTALEAAYAAAPLLLKNQPNKVYWVTRSMWDNYYNSLISASSGFTEAAYMALQSGKETLTYKGIPVRPVDLWDQFLAESDNPLYAVTRNLVLLTVKENHILGVENSADLNRIDSWFEQKDQKRYYRSNFKLGYNYLHCDLQVIVY